MLWSLLFLGIVAGFPVAVLLLVEINALRYQSELITIVQRVWLAFDLVALVWFFARDPLCGDKPLHVRTWRRLVHWTLLIGTRAAAHGFQRGQQMFERQSAMSLRPT
jgi:hypothetical protein